MNQTNNLGLVRSPSNEVEKTAPRAKRILSGLVADTLELAKQKTPSKPIFTVLAGRCLGDLFERIIKQKLAQQYDLRFVRFGDDGEFYCDKDGIYAGELCDLAQKQPFDLIVAYGPMGTEEIKLLADLKNRYGKPIIATSGLVNNEKAEQMKNVNLTFLPAPFDAEEFWSVLRKII